jgi:hypothetical protein
LSIDCRKWNNVFPSCSRRGIRFSVRQLFHAFIDSRCSA